MAHEFLNLHAPPMESYGKASCGRTLVSMNASRASYGKGRIPSEADGFEPTLISESIGPRDAPHSGYGWEAFAAEPRANSK